MSQGFKLKFDHLKENDPTPRKESTPNEDNAFYPSESNTRNLCLIWLDGRMQFLNYAYLISGEFNPNENKIILTFTTHIIVMKGSGLQSLFKSLNNHLPQTITEIEERYSQLGNKDSFEVLKIEINSIT